MSTPSCRLPDLDKYDSVKVDDLKDIQAGPMYASFLLGFTALTICLILFCRAPIPTRASVFLFFSIKDVTQFRTLFRKHVYPNITSSDVARRMRDEVYRAKALSKMVDLAGVNVSFSQNGLATLGLKDDTGDEAFKEGQLSRASGILGDDTERWLGGFKEPETIHGLFEVAGYPPEHVQKVAQDVIKDLSTSICVVFEHCGKARPGEQKGHEHCKLTRYCQYLHTQTTIVGFNDGISQPYVKFVDDDEQQPKRKPLPGQNVANPGVLVLGQPWPEDPNKDTPRPRWTKNGSFLVYRHLKQLVPEFNEFLRQTVWDKISKRRVVADFPYGEAELKKEADFLGARLMGRWKSGMIFPDSEIPWLSD